MSRVSTNYLRFGTEGYTKYLNGTIEWTEWDSEHKAYIEYSEYGVGRP